MSSDTTDDPSPPLISSTKINPLSSPTKEGVGPPLGDKANASVDGGGGSTGTDTDIDHSRIDPLGGRGQYQHPLPHADTQGVIGRDETVEGSKIDPLTAEKTREGGADVQGEGEGERRGGLDDELVDGSRIEPVGVVREEMSG